MPSSSAWWPPWMRETMRSPDPLLADRRVPGGRPSAGASPSTSNSRPAPLLPARRAPSQPTSPTASQMPTSPGLLASLPAPLPDLPGSPLPLRSTGALPVGLADTFPSRRPTRTPLSAAPGSDGARGRASRGHPQHQGGTAGAIETGDRVHVQGQVVMESWRMNGRDNGR